MSRRVTCSSYPSGKRVHKELPTCKRPKGVALVPYRGPKDIREGDILRIKDHVVSFSGLVGEVTDGDWHPETGPVFEVNGFLFDSYEVERIA